MKVIIKKIDKTAFAHVGLARENHRRNGALHELRGGRGRFDELRLVDVQSCHGYCLTFGFSEAGGMMPVRITPSLLSGTSAASSASSA